MLAGAVVLLGQAALMASRPPLDLSPSQVAVRYTPVAGGWEVRAEDARIGGLSGLEWDRGQLIGVTDAGFVVRLDPPGSPHPRASLIALPATAGDPRFKVGRDSEAIRRDPLGRGWWVAFENIDSLLLYDPDLTRLLARVPLSDPRFTRNLGAESLWADGKTMRWAGEWTGLSDAVRLSDGRFAALHRRLSPLGFTNALEVDGARRRLPLGALDNAEGIAAAPLANGGTRLWIVTDDDQRPWRVTKLLKVDLPPQR